MFFFVLCLKKYLTLSVSSGPHKIPQNFHFCPTTIFGSGVHLSFWLKFHDSWNNIFFHKYGLKHQHLERVNKVFECSILGGGGVLLTGVNIP